MDSESEESAADEPVVVPNRFTVDLEISSVFKPRPVRTRVHSHAHPEHMAGGKNKRVKKHKHLNMLNTDKGGSKNEAHAPAAADPSDKAQSRRQGRDRRRDEKRKALEARATQAVEPELPVATQESAPAVSDTVKPAADGAAEAVVAVDAVDGAVDDTVVDDDDDVFALAHHRHALVPHLLRIDHGRSPI